MTTSPRDRLTNLFADTNIPIVLDHHQADQSNTNSVPEMGEQQGNPTVSIFEHSQDVLRVQELPHTRRDVLTSSEDDDDYVAAFSKKAKMKHDQPSLKSNSKTASHGKSLTPTYQSRPQSAPQRQGLLSYDDQGNIATGHFCLFRLVAKYPYQYVVDENDRISRHFFAGGKFYERSWDIYYLHAPEFSSVEPLLLVRQTQVTELVHEINKTLKLDLSVPPDPFTLSFFDDGTPQPILLGTSTSKVSFTEMLNTIPAVPPGHGNAPLGASDRLSKNFAAYHATIARGYAAIKRKKATAKKKKAVNQRVAIEGWCMQLQRAQSYFGLRPNKTLPVQSDPNMTWSEENAFHAARIDSTLLQPLDITKEAPFDFNMMPVIISLDVESYERDHSRITEIGVSTIDTLDLVGLPPGKGGEDWMKHIRSRHFRIRGHEHLLNKDFCIGHPDDFQFGESEFVSLEEAPRVIDSCFKWPFSESFKHDGRLKCDVAADNAANLENQLEQSSIPLTHTSSRPIDTIQDMTNHLSSLNTNANASSHPRYGGKMLSDTDKRYDSAKLKERTVLLVGHDTSTDLAYLARLGCTVATTFSISRKYDAAQDDEMRRNLPQVFEVLDTALLYRAIMRESQSRSLGSLLVAVERCGWYMHNGGNDARYTLDVLIGLVIKARLQEDQAKLESDSHNQQIWAEERDRRLQERLESLRMDVLDECDAWEDVGGAPLTNPQAKTLEPRENVSMPQFNKAGEHFWMTPFSAKYFDSPSSTSSTEFLGLAKKKSAEQKRREREMALIAEDPSLGPIDFAPGAMDGCAE